VLTAERGLTLPGNFMKYSTTLTVQRVRNGCGIVALKPFAAGATLCTVRGQIVSAATVWRYWERDPRRGANCFRFDAGHYLDPVGEIGAWANHSCNPNSGVFRTRSRLLLRALRPIAAGEEVTHDYSTLLGADDIWSMRCNCGDRRCRKVVRNIARLPAAVIRRYVAYGAIPDFILAGMR